MGRGGHLSSLVGGQTRPLINFSHSEELGEAEAAQVLPRT